MAKRRLAMVALAAVLAVGAAACSSKSTSGGGGGGDNTTQPPKPSATATKGGGGGGGASVLTVKTESNFTFSPDKFTVNSGDSITVQNASGFTHTFTVDGQNVDTTVSDGQSTKVPIDLPSGSYQFFCQFHGTATSGMHGTLTVK
jgi:plastocyanin